MSASRLLLGLAVVGALATGCRRPRCEDLQPAPVAGAYRGSGTLGDERMLRVTLKAESKRVVLTYTSMDGARIRATYRVMKQRKEP